MHQNHLIDKVTFEIGLTKSRDAFDFQNSCSNLIHEELLAAIEDVCDQYSSPDEHIIIDKLEVDLGKLSAQNFQWEMLEKFKSKFNLASIKKVRLFNSDTSASRQLLADTQAKEFEHPSEKNNSALYNWEVIKHFLINGNLPWFVEPESFHGFENSIIQLIKTDSPLKSELKILLRDPKNLTRFLSQTSEATINLVYVKLFAKNIDWIDFFHVAEKSISEISHSSIFTPHQKLWQTIWQQSLTDASSNLVLSSVWITILKNYPYPAALIINKYFQDQALFFNVTGVERSSFLTSLEAAKIEQLNIEYTSLESSRDRQPDESLQELNYSSTRQNQETDIKENEIEQLSTRQSTPENEPASLNQPPLKESSAPPKTANSIDFSEMELLHHTQTIQNRDPLFSPLTEDYLPGKLKNIKNRINSQESTHNNQPAESLHKLNLSSPRKNQETDIKENKVERLSTRQSATENEPDSLNQSSPIGSSAPFKKANTIGFSEMELLQRKRHTQTIQNRDPLFSPLPEDSLQRKLKDFKNRMDSPDSLQKEIVASIERSKQSELSLMEKPEQDRYLIENAGLVIFWPYLQIYFEDLGLLKNKYFKDKSSQEKSIHLLQYIASGKENVEEHALTLNKILCDWDTQEPLNRFVALSRKDKNESENLINSVIQNWSILGKTSKDTLQQNFILRKGILESGTNGWLLRVEKGPYDVLIENLPWSLSMIKLSWMKQLLHVEW